MQHALVTGASGHIGANLVRDLLAHGYRVTALARPTSDTRGLDGLDLTLARGDVLDAASVAAALEGCSVVFHLAAPYVVWSRDPVTDIVTPAVQGTEHVLRAAKAAGVRRVVVTSSCNAVGFTRGAPLDETHWNERTTSPYLRAKNEQERLAHRLGAELGLEVVTVLPTAVLGPHDYRKTPTTAPVLDALAGGRVPFPMNLVDARDVARGHVLAAERGIPGERYLLGGDDADTATLASIIEELTGRRPAEGLPPAWVLRTVATLAEAFAPVTGKAPPITRALLDDVDGGVPLFDCAKARVELGLAPRGAREVLEATLAWAIERGWLPASTQRRAA